MRPLELALLLTGLVAFLALAARSLGRFRWLKYSALVAAVVAVAQAVAEGPRWQMAPAYVLSGLFLLVWLRRSGAQQAQPGVQPLRRRTADTLVIGLGVLALAFAAALPWMIPVFRFPEPQGPYGIGTAIYHWRDANRAEIITSDPNDRRELMVQLWYPTHRNRPSQRASYVNGSDLQATAQLMHLPSFFFDHFKYVRTNAEPFSRSKGCPPTTIGFSAISTPSVIRTSATRTTSPLTSSDRLCAGSTPVSGPA
jgi:hypothetical protein